METPIHLQPVTAEQGTWQPQNAQLPTSTGSTPAAAEPDPQWRTLPCAVTDVGTSATALAMAEHKLYSRIFTSARDIARERSYVGYSFFVLLGLARLCKPFMWEGACRINLMEEFAPWSVDDTLSNCAVDGVVCCMWADETSENNPLDGCRQFVACHSSPDVMECGGASMQAFYARLGVILLGTVADGDCGLDTACIMLSLPQDAATRR